MRNSTNLTTFKVNNHKPSIALKELKLVTININVYIINYGKTLKKLNMLFVRYC